MKDGYYRVTLVHKNPPKGITRRLTDWIEVISNEIVCPEYFELGFQLDSIDESSYMESE